MNRDEHFKTVGRLVAAMPPSRWQELMASACLRRCLVGMRELIDGAPSRVTEDDRYLDIWREIEALEALTGV